MEDLETITGNLLTTVLTVVDCQNLPTVHLNKTAQRELRMLDPQLLRPLKGNSLQTKSLQVN